MRSPMIYPKKSLLEGSIVNILKLLAIQFKNTESSILVNEHFSNRIFRHITHVLINYTNRNRKSI